MIQAVNAVSVMLLHLLALVVLAGHPVLSSPPFPQTFSLQPVLQPLQLPPIQSRSLRSGNETGNFLRKLNLFSKLMWKSREQTGDLTASDSSPVTRFSPYTMPSPITMRPYPSLPLASPSMRGMSYYPTPYFMNPDPYGMARRVALAPRHAYMPASAMPAYFPLGSMTGTPILDPNFQAALASSLVNRYSPPLPLIGGPSFLSSSLYEDGIDQASLANILKRYFKNNKKSKYSKYGDELPHKSEYDYGYSPRYDTIPRIKYPISRPSRIRADAMKGYDYTVDRSLEEIRSESQLPADDNRFDARTSADGPLTTPSLPRYRDRPENPKEVTSESYVDIYGWRGPSRPSSERISESDGRDKNDSFRYPSDSLSYGSGSASSSSSFDKEKDRSDGEKERSV